MFSVTEQTIAKPLVVPAKAGTQAGALFWTPAFAGVAVVLPGKISMEYHPIGFNKCHSNLTLNILHNEYSTCNNQS